MTADCIVDSIGSRGLTIATILNGAKVRVFACCKHALDCGGLTPLWESLKALSSPARSKSASHIQTHENWLNVAPFAASLGIPACALLAVALTGCHQRQTPSGNDLPILTASDLTHRIHQSKAPVTLVHVWATWCGPCREEFSTLLQFRNEFTSRGVSIILISADSPQQKDIVMNYLNERGGTLPSYIIDNPNEAFINTLSTNWSGALPASFFFGPKGNLLQWWEGKAEIEQYREAANRLLQTENGDTK